MTSRGVYGWAKHAFSSGVARRYRAGVGSGGKTGDGTPGPRVLPESAAHHLRSSAAGDAPRAVQAWCQALITVARHDRARAGNVDIGGRARSV